MIYNYIVKIMISNFRKTFFYALIALFVLGCDSTKKKPNFVFIYTDDQRFDTVGLIGNSEVKTPHLNDLANNGAVFHMHITWEHGMVQYVLHQDL